MKGPFSVWRKTLLDRFSDREDIGIDGVYTRYFMKDNLPRDQVFECLKLIEFEYELPAGLIRPDDKLEKLLKPVETRNPLRWLFYRSREEDSESEINYELGKRLRRYGTIESWNHVTKFRDLTFRDLIKAWCGLTPN